MGKYDGHTPGPWHIHDREILEKITIGGIRVWSRGGMVCAVYNRRGLITYDKIMNNAHLIADAPLLAARVEQLETQLEHLTPGGSEFHNSPDRCLQFIKDSMASNGKLAVERNKALSRVEELEALLRECHEILSAPADYSYEEMYQLADRVEEVLHGH